jgi:hypothetical protein
MLLGAFDDATGIVHIDKVTGTPPDSYLSATYFHHGVDGTQEERVSAEVKRTASTSGFVGFWHSHPFGPAYPSPTDEQGMVSIVAPDGTTRRALMMILGGDDATWRTWRDHDGSARPDVYLRVVPRSDGPVLSGHPAYVGGLDLQQLPGGWYYRGGYGGRVRVGRAGTPVTSPAAGAAGRLARWWQRRSRS